MSLTLDEVISSRNIKEVLHFTTNRGLLGILATGGVKSRRRLPNEAHVEYLFMPNTEIRKDLLWTDYVNLSISDTNSRFLSWSRRQARQDDRLFWCILSFSPEILVHSGVLFATTNNIYSGVKRGKKAEDLEALFAPRVHRYEGYYSKRSSLHRDCCPTCDQAEILYPGELSIFYLERIYVLDGDTQDEVHAMMGAVACENYEVVIDKSKFKQT